MLALVFIEVIRVVLSRGLRFIIVGRGWTSTTLGIVVTTGGGRSILLRPGRGSLGLIIPLAFITSFSLILVLVSVPLLVLNGWPLLLLWLLIGFL